ncbi:esterase-like activity of phytase family protein (plasmid) [Rhizobium leguminosarum]|uniref:esterase-like activity of phytase family protein n=1 Tax=Rhizobium TaxID=379 RepID=UPI0010305776|nr:MULTISPECIES: esterase-like activity of phytase family protein [Rhizobium]MBY5378361.1 esterase-like activity of phytase family protein [Rhizobium leguminosarum]MBY5416498.1 esterase-like activity of phytase family protein [Rhizobium leguminosarum]NEH49516.1 esterase-like activity of phytase family protein [Rhizobium leguminosarum]NEH57929.1 esterase-like activity of phytase family protein [Rhizobium leguminosarum]TBF24936.1 esterase-like activity of phytase family protein [Rhizobium legumi
MLGRFLMTASFVILSSAASIHATEIGATVETRCPFGDCAAGISLSYLGEFTLPGDYMENGTPLGGLSGLDFVAATGRYIAVSDDRSEKGPARFFDLDIDVSAAGLTGVTVGNRVVLEDKDGHAFAPRNVDPESIRIGRDGIYWGNEGDAKTLAPPFVRVTSHDGAFVRELKLPDGFAPTSDKSAGIRDNLAFEALAVTPSGDVFAGLEAALYQDGPNPSLTIGSLSRIIHYDGTTGEPKAEYVYPVSQIPQVATKAGGGNDNGLSEMIALDDHRLIAVERSFAQGFGNNVKLFMMDLADATDVSGIASLAKSDERIVPIRKSQILDLRAIGLTPDNIESMAIGKAKDGTDVLILAADNNFSGSQRNQFYAFQIKRSPR